MLPLAFPSRFIIKYSLREKTFQRLTTKRSEAHCWARLRITGLLLPHGYTAASPTVIEIEFSISTPIVGLDEEGTEH